MIQHGQGRERLWIVVVDSEHASSRSVQLVPERLPVPLQRLQVSRLKDVLILCRQGFRVGWVVWRMRSVQLSDRECCEELASEFPDVPVFALLQTNEASEQTLDQLNNVCFIMPCESSALVIQHLVAASAQMTEQHITLMPGVVYFPDARCVNVHGEQVMLTEKEQAVLHYLWSRRGQYVATEELIAAVWDEYTGSDAVRQYVYRLRKKLDSPDAGASLIVHMPGSGYKLAESVVGRESEL